MRLESEDDLSKLEKKLGEVTLFLFDYCPQGDDADSEHKVTYYLDKKILGYNTISLYDVLKEGKLHCNL